MTGKQDEKKLVYDNFKVLSKFYLEHVKLVAEKKLFYKIASLKVTNVKNYVDIFLRWDKFYKTLDTEI